MVLDASLHNTQHYHIYPTPPLGQDMTQGQFFKRSLTGLNSEFSFSKTSCLTKAEEPSLPYYKVRIKDKVEESWEWSSALLYTLVLLVSKREPLGHPRQRWPTLHTFTIWLKQMTELEKNQSTMEELSSKIQKKKKMKITQTSQFNRYMYRNLLKIPWNTMDWIYSKIVIGFNRGFLTTSNLRQA